MLKEFGDLRTGIDSGYQWLSNKENKQAARCLSTPGPGLKSLPLQLEWSQHPQGRLTSLWAVELLLAEQDTVLNWFHVILDSKQGQPECWECSGRAVPDTPAASLLGLPNIVSSFEAQTLGSLCVLLPMSPAKSLPLTIKRKPSAKGLALQQNRGPGVAASSFPRVCASL